MGTPEDVAAEEYFTPPTLTEMLDEGMLDPFPKPDATYNVKLVFKEWLRTVGLPNYQSYGKGGVPISATESLRQLLILLVDEP